jgi:hypothetical protein
MKKECEILNQKKRIINIQPLIVQKMLQTGNISQGGDDYGIRHGWSDNSNKD